MKQKATLGPREIEFEWDSTNPDFDSWTVGKLREEAKEKLDKEIRPTCICGRECPLCWGDKKAMSI